MRSSSLRLRLTIGLLLYAAVLSATLFVAGIVLSEHHERLVWNDLLTDVLVRDLQVADVPIADTLTSGVRLIDLDSPAA
ncbi:MAG: sensor histidine kinase, partial [Betaproteobacteria bacterium]|nr:sensor histidine kinase [Betaproteobacteria bacterium]